MAKIRRVTRKPNTRLIPRNVAEAAAWQTTILILDRFYKKDTKTKWIQTKMVKSAADSVRQLTYSDKEPQTFHYYDCLVKTPMEIQNMRSQGQSQRWCTLCTTWTKYTYPSECWLDRSMFGLDGLVFWRHPLPHIACKYKLLSQYWTQILYHQVPTFSGQHRDQAIRQYSLVKHFPTVFGLSKADIDHEAQEGYDFNDVKELSLTKVEAPLVNSKKKLTNISSCECEAGNSTSAGNLKGSHDPVTLSRVVASVEGRWPVKEYPNIDGHIGAVLEYTEPAPGLVRRKRKEELLNHSWRRWLWNLAGSWHFRAVHRESNWNPASCATNQTGW